MGERVLRWAVGGLGFAPGILGPARALDVDCALHRLHAEVQRMKNLMRTSVVLAVALASVSLAGARPASAGDKVKKINRYAVAQEQDGVRVAVSWELARHSDGKFLPLLVNVVNAGSGAAKVELKNFTLVDEEGDVYRAASYADVLSVHGDLGRDKRVMRQLEYGGLGTAPQRFVESSFYPHEQGVQDVSTELLTNTQMLDMVYFDVPARMRDKKLTLVVEGIIDAPAFRVPFVVK
jgi:hypothetical protein